MWYLDVHTEENIIKNMNRFGYLPKIAEYIGESKSGNYKFSYNMKQLVFSKQGELLSDDVLPRKTKRLRKSEKREKRKTERETFQEDYNRAKPHIEMLLKEDNPLFMKLSLSNQKPSQTEINLIYAKNRDSLEKSLAVYQIPLSFYTDGYEKKDNATFTSYVLRHIKKNLRNIEKAYEKAVKKNMHALYIQEGNTHSYTAHPTQGFYICLKKAEAKIPCQADSSKCFSVEYAGNGLIRTPYIKPAALAIIKEEMRKTICRKDVCLSSRMYTEVKKYVNRYQQWLDKRLDAVNYPSGFTSTYNTTPKCQIKGDDFSTVFVGSGILIKNGQIRFADGIEKEFEKKRFQTAFHDAKELLGSYHYVSGKGVLQGDTKVFAARSGITSIGVIHVPCYKNSLTVWRKQLKKEIKRLDKEMEVRIREQEKALIEKYEKLLSDFLTQDILKTVALNEDYITENVVCAMLRGTKVNLQNPRYIENAGRYNSFSKEEITTVIVRLLKENLLTRKRIDGYYGVYYLLKMTLDGERCLSSIPLIKKGGSIDSEKHFQRYQKKETGIKQYLELLDLIFEDRSFFCVYQDEVFRFLKKAPKEFKVLVKMRKSIETDKFRLKVYREILKR